MLDDEVLSTILAGFSFAFHIHSNVLTNIRMNKMREKIEANLKSFSGNMIQKYPIYSSKTVNGKPLFAYARAGEKVEIPERKVFIKNISLTGTRTIKGEDLLENINKRIRKVNKTTCNPLEIVVAVKDFRQEEIIKTWEKNLEGKGGENFFIASFKIECSSGTYVRAIANSLGEKLGVPVLAFTIARIKVGKFTIK